MFNWTATYRKNAVEIVIINFVGTYDEQDKRSLESQALYNQILKWERERDIDYKWLSLKRKYLTL